MSARGPAAVSATPVLRIWWWGFVFTALVAWAWQGLVLPYVLPQWHAGHGLLIDGDWVGLHRTAAALAARIHREGWSIWQFHPEEGPPAGLVAAVYALTAPEPWTMVPIHAALHALAGVVMLRLAQRFVPDWRRAIWAALPVVLYPSAMLWYATLLKDNYTVAGSLMMVYGVVLWAGPQTREAGWRRPLAGSCWILAGGALNWTVRPYFVLVLRMLIGLFGALIVLGLAARAMRRRDSWIRPLAMAALLWGTMAGLLPLTMESYFQVSSARRQTGPFGEEASVTPQAASAPAVAPERPLQDAPAFAALLASELSPASSATVRAWGQRAAPSFRRRVRQAEPAAEAPAAVAQQVLIPQEAAGQTSPPEDPGGAPSADSGTGDVEITWRPTLWLPGFLEQKLAWMARVREGYRGAYPEARTNVDEGRRLASSGQVLAYWPRALQIACFAPFPNQWFGQGSSRTTSAMRRVAAVEMCGVYLALLMLPYAAWRWRRRTDFWCLLGFCLSLLVLWGTSVVNIGVIYRYRYPFLMTLVGVGVLGWQMFWGDLRMWLKGRAVGTPLALPETA